MVWRCQQLVSAEHCALYVIDREQNTLRLAAHTRDAPSTAATAAAAESEGGLPALRREVDGARELTVVDADGFEPFDVGRGIVGRVAATARHSALDAPADDAGFDAAVDNPRAIAPLRSMLCVSVPASSAPSEDDGTSVLQVVN